MKRILLAILFLVLTATPSLAGYGGELEVNAATDVKIGPFVDVGDGFTPQTDIGDPDGNNDLDGTDESYLIKHSAADNAAVQINSAGSDLTWDQIDNMDGWYNLSLTATEVSDEGMLTIVIQDDSDCLPVVMHYMVLSEAAYNSKYGVDDDDTGYMRVDVMESGDVAQTANDNGGDINTLVTGVTVSAIGADVITPASVDEDADFVIQALSITNALDAGSVVVDAGLDVVGALSANSLLIDTTSTVTGTTLHTGAVTLTNGINVGALSGTLAADLITASALKADAATEIIDDFETQSQADPTGFWVNLKEINGTATQLEYLIDKTTAINADADLTTIVVDKSIFSHVMTPAANTDTYRASTDSLEANSGLVDGIDDNVWDDGTRTLTALDEDGTTIDLDGSYVGGVTVFDEDSTTIDIDGTTLGTVSTLTGHTAQGQDHTTNVNALKLWMDRAPF